MNEGHDPTQWLPNTFAQHIGISSVTDEEIIHAAAAALTEKKSTWTETEARREITWRLPTQHQTSDQIKERSDRHARLFAYEATIAVVRSVAY